MSKCSKVIVLTQDELFLSFYFKTWSTKKKIWWEKHEREMKYAVCCRVKNLIDYLTGNKEKNFVFKWKYVTLTPRRVNMFLMCGQAPSWIILCWHFIPSIRWSHTSIAQHRIKIFPQTRNEHIKGKMFFVDS